MTSIYIKNNKITRQGNEVGISQACCRGCGENCEFTVSVDVSDICEGGSISFTFDVLVVNGVITLDNFDPPRINNTYGWGQAESGQGACDGAFFTVWTPIVSCGNYGPNCEAGWLIEVYGCGVCNLPFGCQTMYGSSIWWSGFVRLKEGGCPREGNIDIITIDTYPKSGGGSSQDDITISVTIS